MISSRFAIAIHILTLLETNQGVKNTSNYIAGSVNKNPVVIRRIMSLLNKAGLIHAAPGIAGATLARRIDEITLYDIYKAVQVVDPDDLFSVHGEANPQCPVGQNIQFALESVFNKAQSAMENVLNEVTLDQLVLDIKERSK